MLGPHDLQDFLPGRRVENDGGGVLRAARSLAQRKRVGRKHGGLYVPREEPYVSPLARRRHPKCSIRQRQTSTDKCVGNKRRIFGQPSHSSSRRQTLQHLSTAAAFNIIQRGASYTLRDRVEDAFSDFSSRDFYTRAGRSTGGVVLLLLARSLGDRTPKLRQNFFKIVPNFAARLLGVVAQHVRRMPRRHHLDPAPRVPVAAHPRHRLLRLPQLPRRR